MVALTIAGIMLGMAVISFPAFVERQVTWARLESLATAIQIARHTAVKYNVRVTMCPAATHNDPEDVCGARNTWHNGATVFTDRNGNRRQDETDREIARLQPIDDATVYWRSFRNRSYLRFTGKGMTDWQNGTSCTARPVATRAGSVRSS